LEEDTYNC